MALVNAKSSGPSRRDSWTLATMLVLAHLSHTRHVVDAFHPSSLLQQTRRKSCTRLRRHHPFNIGSAVCHDRHSGMRLFAEDASGKSDQSKQQDANNRKSKKRSRRKRQKPRNGKSARGGSPSASSSASVPRDPNALETWRLYDVTLTPEEMKYEPYTRKSKRKINLEQGGRSVPVQERYAVPALLQRLNEKLKNTKDSSKDDKGEVVFHNVEVVRRSLDARKKRRNSSAKGNQGADGNAREDPKFVHVVDITLRAQDAKRLHLRPQSGKCERIDSVHSTDTQPEEQGGSTSTDESERTTDVLATNNEEQNQHQTKKKVVVVGAGPAGLFCALVLAQSGKVQPILVERGQPVERRGRDIGALVRRHKMNSDSNFAFGEGGAGTWSDGKLTTRIGRNSDPVRYVLRTLVKYGAPENILVEGAPHLGTDALVQLLRKMRVDLKETWGAEIKFGTKVVGLNMHTDDSDVAQTRTISGVEIVDVEESATPSEPDNDIGNEQLEKEPKQTHQPHQHDAISSSTINADATVLATGHSARDVYESLHEAGVTLEPKGFAVGFRIEHPQSRITEIQYGKGWGTNVITGKTLTDKANDEYFKEFAARSNSNDDVDGSSAPSMDPTAAAAAAAAEEDNSISKTGRLPVPSYRLATDRAFDGSGTRGVYSFCMCPGGQIVPASTDPAEVCVNGMSFSRRDSVWANSALVVTVNPDDDILGQYREEHGVLAGIAFQRDMERRAAELGGGGLVVPVQRVTDFIEGAVSDTVPSSSYRLGVKSAPCHEIYPAPLTAALRDALQTKFASQMPGYVHPDGLLHAVETRTSSPVRMSRDRSTYLASNTTNLFPAGEGAGFAGGIVSAAVDGIGVAEAVLRRLFPDEDAANTSASGSADGSEAKRPPKIKPVGFSY